MYDYFSNAWKAYRRWYGNEIFLFKQIYGWEGRGWEVWIDEEAWGIEKKNLLLFLSVKDALLSLQTILFQEKFFLKQIFHSWSTNLKPQKIIILFVLVFLYLCWSINTASWYSKTFLWFIQASFQKKNSTIGACTEDEIFLLENSNKKQG